MAADEREEIPEEELERIVGMVARARTIRRLVAALRRGSSHNRRDRERGQGDHEEPAE